MHFRKDLDITTSDLALGLSLLRWQSLQWIGGHSRVPAENVLKQTDPVTTDIAAPLDLNVKNPIDKLTKNWLHISYLKRYCSLVNASYGWIWYCGDILVTKSKFVISIFIFESIDLVPDW
ncbi:hypothetical protein ACTXT7_011607 [Hymenolepis weldensis]